MKTKEITGIIAKVNENAYNTWLEPYIGMNVQISKTSKNFAWVVQDYGNGEQGLAKCAKEYFDL